MFANLLLGRRQRVATFQHMILLHFGLSNGVVTGAGAGGCDRRRASTAVVVRLIPRTSWVGCAFKCTLLSLRLQMGQSSPVWSCVRDQQWSRLCEGRQPVALRAQRRM
jgi:hypothetical protein